MALDLADKTANGNTLTNTSGTEVTTDLPFAQSTIAVDLESATPAYLTAADSASLSITGNITLELWVKFESTPASGVIQTFLAKWNDNGVDQRSYWFALQNSAGTLRLLFSITANGISGENLVRNWTPSTGVWYHVAVSWTASTSTAQFVVDGVQQGADVVGTVTSLFNSIDDFQIGAINEATAASPFDGVIDEVRVWNTARTVTQINDNKSIELTGSESGLQAYWPLEAALGSATVVADDYAYFL